MDFLYIKALHIIFVVTWFAGLFYVGRLFIYHVEAEKKDETAKGILQTQYKLMTKRLWYIITWPSLFSASFFAIWMLIENPIYLELPWMHVKLAFVLALYFYHGFCHKIYKELQRDEINYSPTKLRILNEAPTVILFAVVFLVVLKNTISWVWGVVGIILFGVLLMFGIQFYKKLRAKKSWDKQDKELLKKQNK